MNIDGMNAHRDSVTTRSGEISYIDVGSGPVALFVHGIGTNAHLWRNLVDLVAADRRCVALDLPLHGQSPARRDQDFTISGLASVLEQFCEGLALSDVDLVAHDTGGAIAQVFAARNPTHLRTLCLTNCDTHDNVPPEAFQPTVDLAASGALAASAPSLLADLQQARSVVFGTGYEDVQRLELDVVRAYLEPVLGTPERAEQFERLLLSLNASDLLDVEADLERPHRSDARRLGNRGRLLRRPLGLLAP